MNYFHAHYPYGLYITTRIVCLLHLQFPTNPSYPPPHHNQQQPIHRAGVSGRACYWRSHSHHRLQVKSHTPTQHSSSLSCGTSKTHLPLFMNGFFSSFCLRTDPADVPTLWKRLVYAYYWNFICDSLYHSLTQTCYAFLHVFVIVRMRRAILYKRHTSDRTQHHSSDSIRIVSNTS